MTKKDAYIRKIEAKVEEIDADIRKMKAQAKGLGADGEIQFYRTIDEYDANRDALVKKLDTMRNSGDDAFADIQEGIDWALGELNEIYNKAKWRYGL